MQFDWWTFGFELINILVLIWLLSRFLFRPVANIIKQRETETANVIQAAETAKQDAIIVKEAAEAEMASLVAERFKIADAAREDAGKQSQEIISKAKMEAKRIISAAKFENKAAAKEAHQLQLQLASELAVTISGRLLANLPEDCRVLGYDKRLAKALTNLDKEQRQAISGEPEKARLVAPRPLTPQELENAENAIRSFIIKKGPILVSVDETLIAGLELRGPHGVVHNSLGYDLTRMQEALSKNGKS